MHAQVLIISYIFPEIRWGHYVMFSQENIQNSQENQGKGT